MLREFHDVIERHVKRYVATVGFLQGDCVQLFFNDAVEIPDAPLRAVRSNASAAVRAAGLVSRCASRALCEPATGRRRA